MSTPETSASPLPVLQQPLDEIVREMGFTKVKPKQLEAIVAVVSGNGTLIRVFTYGLRQISRRQSPRSYLHAVEARLCPLTTHHDVTARNDVVLQSDWTATIVAERTGR